MVQRWGTQDVETQRRHKEGCVIRRNVDDGQPGLGTEILRGDRLLANGGRESEQGTEDFHSVNVVLPDMESFRAQFDRQGSVERLFVMQVHGERLGYLGEGAESMDLECSAVDIIWLPLTQLRGV